MKRMISLVIVILSACSARAQWVHSASDQISSLNWDIIDMVGLTKINDTLIHATYPEEVKRFEGRKFKLTGYMIPMKAGMKQPKFMISTLPINQCYFCGRNGNPIMVIVNAQSPVTFTFKTVTVEGILKLTNDNAYYLPPVYLDQAKLADE